MTTVETGAGGKATVIFFYICIVFYFLSLI
jgi:hypothetical protein